MKTFVLVALLLPICAFASNDDINVNKSLSASQANSAAAARATAKLSSTNIAAQRQAQNQAQKQAQQQSIGDQTTLVGGQTTLVGGQKTTVGDQVTTIGDQVTTVGDQIVDNVNTFGDTQSNSSVGDTTTGDQTVNVQGDSFRQVRQAPIAIAGGGNNTADCFRVWGIGASNTNGGVSFGFPFKDRQCVLSKATQQAFDAGNDVVGWRMYCHQRSVTRVYKYGLPKSLGRKARKSQAIQGCLSDAANRANDPEDRLALVQMIEDMELTLVAKMGDLSRNGDQIRNDLNDLTSRVNKIEPLAHPKGKGFTADMVRKIVREEATCSACAADDEL